MTTDQVTSYPALQTTMYNQTQCESFSLYSKEAYATSMLIESGQWSKHWDILLTNECNIKTSIITLEQTNKDMSSLSPFYLLLQIVTCKQVAEHKAGDLFPQQGGCQDILQQPYARDCQNKSYRKGDSNWQERVFQKRCRTWKKQLTSVLTTKTIALKACCMHSVSRVRLC